MKFSYLDIDDPANDEFKKALGFRVQPQLFLLDGNGEILQQWVGYTNDAQLRDAFEQALQ